MPKRFITYSKSEPARTIIATVATLTFIASLTIFTPWYTPLLGPAILQAFHWPAIIAAFINGLACIPALAGVRRNTPRSLSLGAFWLFIWYLFVTITRIIAGDASTLSWITTLIITFVMATLYLEQGSHARLEEGTDNE